MKKASSSPFCFLKNLLFITMVFNLNSHLAFATRSCEQSFSDGENKETPDEEKPIFLFDKKNGYAYKGLTEYGLQKFKETRDALRARKKLFSNEFVGMENFFHALTTARIAHYHAFLEGPPGGAKTGLVNWFADGESGKKFKIQLDPMKPEQALIGGMRLDEAQKGLYVINTEGSIADNVHFAIIDEMHLGHPGVLTVLKSILNERKVWVGQVEIPVELQSLFATSNATLDEVYEYFESTGHGPSAAALFNRFQIKAFVYNWLPASEQSDLFNRKLDLEALKALSRVHPDAVKDSLHFLKPDPIDWNFLHNLQTFLFTSNRLYRASYIELMNELRKQAHNQLKESIAIQETNSNRRRTTGAITAEYSDRLMLQGDKAIKSSALLSFMLSPLADDENLALLENPITLDQTSLWRAHQIATTIGSGIAILKFFKDGEDDKSGSGLKLVLDLTKHPNPKITNQIDLNNLRDDREQFAIKSVQEGQQRFAEIYNGQTKRIQYQLEIVARSRSTLVPKNFKGDQQSFEVLLLNASGDLGESHELIQKKTP